MRHSKKVRDRLAPSPTGALHLGNARSFLLAWLSVRSRGGTLVLRMEDLDHPKVKPHAAHEAIEDLRWLGLDWDEGPDIGGPHAPYTQSERREHYRAALAKLRARGSVYPCVCSRKDVEAAQSAPHAEDTHGMAIYPGTCRGRFDSWEAACAALPDGRLPAWRFSTETKSGNAASATRTFYDGICGEQHLSESLGDFVLARDPDGAGYMLAVVVDDAAMGITEVVRGDDLLEATHCQIALQNALALPSPAYFHVPLVVAEDGRRLAKRHGDTRLRALREAGVSAERVVGLLAYWCGWAAFGEELRAADLLPRFDFATLNRAPAVLTNDIKRVFGI